MAHAVAIERMAESFRSVMASGADGLERMTLKWMGGL